jgi:hypothetical protein
VQIAKKTREKLVIQRRLSECHGKLQVPLASGKAHGALAISDARRKQRL